MLSFICFCTIGATGRARQEAGSGGREQPAGGLGLREGGVMAIGYGQSLTGRDEAAAAMTAIGAGRYEVPIQLSCRLSADGHAVIAMRGDLDLATVDRVVSYVSDIIDRHDGPVSADLGGVAFCDACGLGALVRIAAYAERAGRRLEMIRPSRALVRIMRITGVDQVLLTPAQAG
jgi:anti-sigma B factor antagonist